MDKKDLEYYAYGIHIGSLTGEETKSILEEYYHIEYFPEISFSTKPDCSEKGDLIRGIYDWTLYVLLLNGYRLPLKGNSAKSIDSSLYFKDMIMLLYLYVINQNEALSANGIQTSSSTNTDLFYIEQSGFGNILGMRRENKFNREGDGKFDSRKVKYVGKFSDECADHNTIEDGICSVKRNEKKKEYHFPYACKNVIEALLKSRKHSSFIFYAKEDETLSKDEIKRVSNIETPWEYFGGIPLKVFENDIQKILIQIAKAGGGAQKKLFQYVNSSIKDIDGDNEYKFYEKYFKELSKSEEKWEKEEGKDFVGRKSCICRANRYLSELLFAYLYYDKAVKLIRKMIDEQGICTDVSYAFLEIIYDVSKSPACFSRYKHLEHYATRFLSISASEKGTIERELYYLKNSIIRNERYVLKKFLPAFFYCFLYHLNETCIIKEKNKRESLIEIENCIIRYIKPFGMLDKVSFQNWIKSFAAKKLWIKRKTDYFMPLDYKVEKALF